MSLRLLYILILFFTIPLLGCTIYSNTAIIIPAITATQSNPTINPTITPSPTAKILPTRIPTAEVYSCRVETNYMPGNLNLRACGGLNCAIIDIIPQGAEITVLDRSGWWLVQYGDKCGFVNPDYLECEVAP